jgi:hypothetical protein
MNNTEWNTEWNPRYLQYCRATGGLSPDATLERDREQYPGGCMCGFILWHDAKLYAAREHHPEFFYIEHDGRVGGLLDHQGYDMWLNKSVEADLAN